MYPHIWCKTAQREDYREGFIIHPNAYLCRLHHHPPHIPVIIIIIFTAAGFKCLKGAQLPRWLGCIQLTIISSGLPNGVQDRLHLLSIQLLLTSTLHYLIIISQICIISAFTSHCLVRPRAQQMAQWIKRRQRLLNFFRVACFFR